jgi:hypothetical protein
VVYNLSIDPGITATAVCVWSADNWSALDKPARCFTIRRCSQSWQTNCGFVTDSLRHDLNAYPIQDCYLEFPANFEGSVKGEAAAKTGALVKLAFLVGRIAEMLESRGVVVHLVPVADWKGQLDKKVVQGRIRYLYGGKTDFLTNEHLWDSVGIGLWAKGFLNR